MKHVGQCLLCICLMGAMGQRILAVEVSSFCRSLVPGKYIIEAEEGNWNWGMAPIYDEKGKLHVFNSIIPKNGSWIKHSKIAHYTADKPEGPYIFVEDTFVSDEASYHNPQVSKVGDTYVLVFLLNRHQDEDGSLQEVGIATAKSLNGPWASVTSCQGDRTGERAGTSLGAVSHSRALGAGSQQEWGRPEVSRE